MRSEAAGFQTKQGNKRAMSQSRGTTATNTHASIPQCQPKPGTTTEAKARAKMKITGGGRAGFARMQKVKLELCPERQAISQPQSKDPLHLRICRSSTKVRNPDEEA